MERKLDHIVIKFRDEMPMPEAQIVFILDDLTAARYETISVSDVHAIIDAAKQDRIAAITQVFGQPTGLRDS